jgi:hypothetical protein
LTDAETDRLENSTPLGAIGRELTTDEPFGLVEVTPCESTPLLAEEQAVMTSVSIDRK